MTGIPIFGPNAFSYQAPSSPGGGWGENSTSITSEFSDVVRTTTRSVTRGSSADLSPRSSSTFIGSRTASAGRITVPLKSANSSSPNIKHSSITGSSNIIHYSNNKIFVGGISWQSTEESLQTYFEQYGPVESVEIMRDRLTGNPRGFAFIHLALPATAENIISLRKNHIIDAKTVDVKRAHARTSKTSNQQIPENLFVSTSNEAVIVQEEGEDGQMESGFDEEVQDKLFSTAPTTPYCYNNNKIFIGGLHPSVDRDELKAHFSIYGYIKDACVMFDPKTKRSRGFGFITYQEGYQAHCAINQRHTFRDKVVELKYAQPKLSTPVQVAQQQQQSATPTPTTTTITTTSTAQQYHSEDNEEKEEREIMSSVQKTQIRREIHHLQKSVQDIRQSERMLISLLQSLVESHNDINCNNGTNTSTPPPNHYNLMVSVIHNLQQRLTSKQGENSFATFNDPTKITATPHNNDDDIYNGSTGNVSVESISSDLSLVDMIVQLDHCLASFEYSKSHFFTK
jgi:RNA-binding protein Musashi